MFEKVVSLKEYLCNSKPLYASQILGDFTNWPESMILAFKYKSLPDNVLQVEHIVGVQFQRRETY